jgi:hypothetical protein
VHARRIQHWAIDRLIQSPDKDDYTHAANLLVHAVQRGRVPDPAGLYAALQPLGAPIKIPKKSTQRHALAARVLLHLPAVPDGVRLRLATMYADDGDLVQLSVTRPDATTAEWLALSAPPVGGWAAWPALDHADAYQRRERLKKILEHRPARRDPAVRAQLLDWLAVAPDPEAVVLLAADGLGRDTRALYQALHELHPRWSAKALTIGDDVLARHLTNADILPHLQSTEQPERLAALTATAHAMGDVNDAALLPSLTDADVRHAIAATCEDVDARVLALGRSGAGRLTFTRSTSFSQTSEVFEAVGSALRLATTLEAAYASIAAIEATSVTGAQPSAGAGHFPSVFREVRHFLGLAVLRCRLATLRAIPVESIAARAEGRKNLVPIR